MNRIKHTLQKEDGGSNDTSLVSTKKGIFAINDNRYRFNPGTPVFNGDVGYLALAEWLEINPMTALSICDGEMLPVPVPWHENFSVRYGKNMGQIDVHDYFNALLTVLSKVGRPVSSNKNEQSFFR